MPIDEFGYRCYVQFLGFILDSRGTRTGYSLHRDMEIGFFTVGWFIKDMNCDDIDLEIMYGERLCFDELFDGATVGVGVSAMPLIYKKRVVVK